MFYRGGTVAEAHGIYIYWKLLGTSSICICWVLLSPSGVCSWSSLLKWLALANRPWSLGMVIRPWSLFFIYQLRKEKYRGLEEHDSHVWTVTKDLIWGLTRYGRWCYLFFLRYGHYCEWLSGAGSLIHACIFILTWQVRKLDIRGESLVVCSDPHS